MSRYRMRLAAVIMMGLWAVTPVRGGFVPIENASFEAPVVDPNGFGALPLAEEWMEIDIDTEGSTNTGVFANTAEDSPDHVVNADGSQLAFLGSQEGNALQQDLAATYKAGCDYQLTAGVGVSMRFPPASEEPVDAIELVLYYYSEDGSAIDVASQTVPATGLSATQLQDFSVYLPTVNSSDPWAGKAVGIAIRAVGAAGGFWSLDDVRLMESLPVSIPIENASFESPAIDPNAFAAWPVADGWTEIDIDTLASTNTGIFGNTPVESWDHVVNADGLQLAFLGSESGNAFEQDLPATYVAGCDYRLTVGVGVSSRYPPSTEVPLDTVELVLYYYDETESVDIAVQAVDATNLSSGWLQDFSVRVPSVDSDDAWAGKNIGIAIRAQGMPGGFWDLDNVRLTESMPVSIPIENASFEAPAIDPNAFAAWPVADAWTEIDIDTLGSTNTGVFGNTAADSPDHVANADGSQLAFLGSQEGNAFQQDLAATYKTSSDYRFTVAVGVSMRFPPTAPDAIELALYYDENGSVVDIASRTVEATGLSTTQLQDFSLHLPAAASDDPWVGKTIGIAIRAEGAAGGFWTLDNVRLGKSLSVEDLTTTD